MKREVAVNNTGNFRRVCPMNGRRFTGERKVSVWDIALRAASIQTINKCEYEPVNPAFHPGERKRPAWCSPKTAYIVSPTRRYGAPPIANILRRQNQVAVSEKIRIRLKSYDHTLVDAAAEKIVETAKRNGATVSGPIPLPTEKEIITILRAVHKYKDSREQFEYRTHKRLIDVIKPSQKAIDALTALELPAGVEVEIKL